MAGFIGLVHNGFYRPLGPAAAAASASLPLPTAAQLGLHEMQTTQFMHFSMCSFTGCEQNMPPANASLFSPTARVDTDQWVRVAKSWGAKQICLTARHSGGFALWQTNATGYGLRQAPYLGGKGDIVRDFVASCRAAGVSPCLYFIPPWDGWQDAHSHGDAEAYLATQLDMSRELLTRSTPRTEPKQHFARPSLSEHLSMCGRYGRIDRLWFDFWGDACGQYGAACPRGAFPQGWRNISALMAEVSPGTTLSMPGTDGCLLAKTSSSSPETGEGAYPSWYYNAFHGAGDSPTSPWSSANPILCEPVRPTAGASLRWAVHEADHSIQNPGDDWFWKPGHAYLNASVIFGHWLRTVGRGSSYILNIPPSTAGVIPEEYAHEAALLGAALRGSFSKPRASADPARLTSLVCGGDGGQGAATISIGEGVVVDAVVAQEDLASGQSIASYTLEVQRDSGSWEALPALGGTVGATLVDLVPPISGPAVVRWACTSSAPVGAMASLASLGAYKLQPPPGWAPPDPPAPPAPPVTWALQTLYSTTSHDMTPCATRDLHATAGRLSANRSACSVYFRKPRGNFSFVRDEHCCFGSPRAYPPTVPLYLLYSSAADDHVVASNVSFAIGGHSYAHNSIECHAFGAATAGAVPLDLYYSAERKDTWALASDASRAQAVATNYTFVATTAYVPAKCS